jgi:hypothetical protein
LPDAPAASAREKSNCSRYFARGWLPTCLHELTLQVQFFSSSVVSKSDFIKKPFFFGNSFTISKDFSPFPEIRYRYFYPISKWSS